MGSWSFVNKLRELFAAQTETEEPTETEEEKGLGDRNAFWENAPQEGGEGECVICLESLGVDKGVVIRAWAHGFHRGCLGNWLKVRNTCPICRKVLCRKERAKTLWEEMDGSGYFIPQLGDMRVLAERSALLERLVSQR